MREMRNFLKFFLLLLLILSVDAQSKNFIDEIAKVEVDSSYGEDGGAGERTTQWRGNCGRGKFFYQNLPYKDSNISALPMPPGVNFIPPNANILTNDIWTSRTGCWNPEERFTFMPPYADFERGEDLTGFVSTGTPDRVKRNITFYEPTGNKNLLLIPNKRPGLPIGTLDPVEGPWDEPFKVDSSGASSYLVPNDRLLMPHPLCTNLVDASATFRSPTGVPLVGSFIKNLFEKQDVVSRVYKSGSIPRCVVEDYADEVDNYCQEYLEDSSALTKLASGTALADYLNGRYSSTRYFFNFDNFCWTHENKPIAYAFDPYEHWMPLAIRASEDSDGDGAADNTYGGVGPSTDIYGNSHVYTKTDVRRPTFTPYAERTVFDESAEVGGATTHVMYSLEEYGYGERPIMRRDYQYNPNNIYDPNSVAITPEELLKEDNMGRKKKMYQCLKMYIEQWAFEGDKGSIYLNAGEYATRVGAGNDASMCQWTAYYDTSENDKDRKHFKNIMEFFVNGSSKGMGFKGKLAAPPFLDAPTKDVWDIRKLGCHEGDDAGSGKNCSNVPNPLAKIASLNTQNTFGMVRKVGMRPEAFDYFNFLTFSALPTAGFNPNPSVGDAFGNNPAFTEKFNLTHNVELSGGGVGFKFVTGLPTAAITLNDIYGTIPDIGTGNAALGSFGINRVNFAKRECKTAIPPQIWNDVVDLNSIAGECNFQIGARLINDLKIDAGGGPIDDIINVGLDAINVTDNRGRKFRHWLTTLVDAPIISLMTTIPTLPVGSIGFQYENLIIPYGIFSATYGNGNPAPLGVGEARDNWHRTAGEKILPYHIIQKPASKRNFYEDSKLGLIVIDENYGTSGAGAPRGRDWVNNSWPARSCMHSWMLGLGAAFYSGFKDIKDDPTDIVSSLLDEGKIYDSWKTFDDIRLDYLAGGVYDYSNGYTFGMTDFKDEYKDAKNDPNNDHRKFGGFRIAQHDPNYYFSWLPTKWSVGVGMYKAFWCEFQLPYFPYVVGNKEYNHNRAPVVSFYKINGKNGLFGKNSLRKRAPDYKAANPKYTTAKPRLEYYRVERIRDACGPFGVRSTWINYEKNVGTSNATKYKFFDWFIGDVSTKDTPPDNYMIKSLDNDGNQYYHIESRCAGWIDMYRKRVNNPKAIGWRLARFDYEFMKSFLECTGPYQKKAPFVCNLNQPEYDYNQGQSMCQSLFALANIAAVEAFADLICSVPCAIGVGCNVCRNTMKDIYKNLPANPFALADCGFGGWGSCHTFCEGRTVGQQITDNVARAFDFASRGDATYDMDDTLEPQGLGFARDDADIDESPGFETWKSNSIRIDKFWLRNAVEDHDVAGDEPFGFWCNCPKDEKGFFNNSDKAKTTRCREDYCTCDQHVIFAARQIASDNFLFAGVPFLLALSMKTDKIKQVFVELGLIVLQSSILPATICADYGPFRRWVQCFYQARASACPVITRDVSDSIPYSSLKDPFTADKKAKDNVPENTQKKQSFNVCTGSNPIGHGDKTVEGFVRWSLEEPNHLARIPVWFESGGASFAHEDFIFQSQVRDWESPFMELSVPFPIDLITRHCIDWGTRVIDEGGEKVEVQACLKEEMTGSFSNLFGYKKVDNVDGEYPNNLSEIQQREGVGYSQIIYNNPPETGTKSPTDEFEITNPLFKTSFLRTRDTTKISPIVNADCFMQDFPLDDPDPNHKCDGKKYQELYLKYAKGLYAVAAANSYTTKPEEPGDPTILSKPGGTGADAEGTDKQDIHPRAQDKIVGPRGCDIGGWWEMMLYQARCIRWHKLNCICDYDKTFAKGNAVNYALKRAGMKFEVVGPTIVGAEYKTELDVGQDGIVYAVLDEAERDISGRAKARIKLGSGGGISMKKRTDNKLVGKYKINPTTGRPELLEVLGGKAVDQRAKYKPGIAISKTPRYFPLKDRGIVGPEFAVKNTEPWDDTGHKIKGLDKVLVGDLLIWDEEITDPNTGLDIGYPRHIAYVEKVKRYGKAQLIPIPGVPAPPKDIPLSIKVSEMNWGKIYDSCGNTNKWGVESQRVIHKPTCASDSSSNPNDSKYCGYDLKAPPPPISFPPAPANPGTIDTYADCRNADWYHCVEKYWDQVKIYRPYLNYTGKYDDVVADPAYTSASCASKADFPKPISKKRIRKLAKKLFEGDSNASPPVAAVHTPPNIGKLKTFGVYNPKKIRSYIQDAYSRVGSLTLDEILYETELWKLLVTTTSYGKYYNDEVNKFLFDPLSGAADNCDPIPELRENYGDLLDDVREVKGVVH